MLEFEHHCSSESYNKQTLVGCLLFFPVYYITIRPTLQTWPGPADIQEIHYSPQEITSHLRLQAEFYERLRLVHHP